MRLYLAIIVIIFSLTSCTIKERIVFKEDGTGKFLMSYDMGGAFKQMKGAFSEGVSNDTIKNKKQGKVVDTTMVFKDMMVQFKDSIAQLSEEKQLAMQMVKDMFMTMKVNEDENVFSFGIGMDFPSVNDLVGIQEKLEKAKSLNAQNDQVGAMKKASPIGKFMENDKNEVNYDLTDKVFSRLTTINETPNEEDATFDESDNQFIDYFKESYYIVEYTFPKKIKSHTAKDASLSADKKTITYKAGWVDFIKSPNALDINIQFEDE
ncbi:hypothetical protein [uncultured Algibacter sp.]|uniref:hypothetical protein n=1 Tax=uncultured Algibacter sp. TaxID=298659 RepID=UPI0032162C83